MYRYDYYYGHWMEDSDSEGEYGYNPNKGEGGRDEGYVPPPPDDVDPPPEDPDPAPTPGTPPATSSLIDTTPAIITLNETDEYAGDVAGYKASGTLTEARAYPLACVKAVKGSETKMVLCKNQRPEYNYAPMVSEIFRFPYYVPPGANLSTLPLPQITWEVSANNTGGAFNADMWIEAVDVTPTYTTSGNYGGIAASNGVVVTTGTKVATLNTSQMLNFIPGQFNEFLFKVTMARGGPACLSLASANYQWMISGLRTSLPTGYEFELKLQKNWESYFNIKVVKDTDRTSPGVSTGITTVSTTPTPINNGWTLSNNWSWNEYNTSLGYKHWEIPIAKFKGNFDFELPITVFPENDEFCSMEPTVKTPGPKAPWNLLSRHESFWYAPTTMRKSDYPQRLSANPIFYCPRNWRGVVWLKQGVAINDTL